MTVIPDPPHAANNSCEPRRSGTPLVMVRQQLQKRQERINRSENAMRLERTVYTPCTPHGNLLRIWPTSPAPTSGIPVPCPRPARVATAAGSTYRNISAILGRKTELTYTTVILRPDEFIELMGENKTLVAHDQMTITSEGSRQSGRLCGRVRVQRTHQVLHLCSGPAFNKFGRRSTEGHDPSTSLSAI